PVRLGRAAADGPGLRRRLPDDAEGTGRAPRHVAGAAAAPALAGGAVRLLPDGRGAKVQPGASGERLSRALAGGSRPNGRTRLGVSGPRRSWRAARPAAAWPAPGPAPWCGPPGPPASSPPARAAAPARPPPRRSPPA